MHDATSCDHTGLAQGSHSGLSSRVRSHLGAGRVSLLVTLMVSAGCATQTQLRQSSGTQAAHARGNGRSSQALAAAALTAAAARRWLSAGPAASPTSGRVRGNITAATAASEVRVRCVLPLDVRPSRATQYSPLAWHAST
jgi:hypothetical protein